MDLTPLDVWRRAMVDSVRRDAPDLTARQIAILLTVYMTKPPHTVRGLAEMLSISKPAVTRALDRLGEFKLARRKSDPRDRRSVLVQRSVRGSVYLAELAEFIAEATIASERQELARKARAAEASPKAESAPKQKVVKNQTARPAAAGGKKPAPKSADTPRAPARS